MYIYDLCKCEKCGKTYKGKFKMAIHGLVSCIDCESPDIYVGLSINTVQYEQRQGLLYEELCELLLKDLEHLYPIIPAEQEAILAKFDGSADIDLNIIYFHQNPMKLIRIMQEIAYLAAHYIIQNNKQETDKKTPMYELSLTLLQSYLRLRVERLTDEQEQSLWNLITKEEIRVLKGAVNYVQMA